MAELVALNPDRHRVGYAIDRAVAIAGEVGQRASVGIAGVIIHRDLRLPLLELIHIDHARHVSLHVGRHVLAFGRPAMRGGVARAIAGEIDHAVPNP